MGQVRSELSSLRRSHTVFVRGRGQGAFETLRMWFIINIIIGCKMMEASSDPHDAYVLDLIV